MLELEWN